ncbi:MarR family transcriptional regulator [Aeromicrobium phragmitis]|uniref:MarR family transcriptional regulator n=2 Tax=Aeromicrobium phragmitis TaxID=2478914 RepID=A0A3L8PIB0_9ACTN|nr:MarR family transcriptional regulator [Aeromicrobium phragmitis]
MDLSFSQARTLFTLAQTDGPLAIGDIAKLVSLSVAAAGRNVDQLVKLGLVERTECDQDRRVKIVALTDKGVELARAHLDAKRDSVRHMLDRLDLDQCERLSEALAPLLALTKEDLYDQH